MALRTCPPADASTRVVDAPSLDTDRDPLTAVAEAVRGPPAPRMPPRLPDVDTRRCTGCGWCVAACDLQLLSLEVVRWTKRSVLHEPARCTGCSACALKCPFHAITMRRPPAVG